MPAIWRMVRRCKTNVPCRGVLQYAPTVNLAISKIFVSLQTEHRRCELNEVKPMRKTFLIFSIIFLAGMSGTVAYAQNSSNEIIANFSHLSPQQLLDTANYYSKSNSFDTALICYSLLINFAPKNTDIEHQKRVVEAYNRSAVLYNNMGDYSTAYDLLIKALLLAEKINYVDYKPRIYNNIGNIYFYFSNYDMAKAYYSKAMSSSNDTLTIINLLNNLGAVEKNSGRLDSAYYFFNKALQISKRHNEFALYGILNNLALIYQERKQYDSAFYHLRLALAHSQKNNNIRFNATNLLHIGKLFLEINQTDSTLFYLNRSKTIATEHKFRNILSEIYLTLSEMEEKKGNKTNALDYHKKYANLKDSVLSSEKFGDVNQLQRLYEVSKTNQQIEELAIEKRIKERTIFWQKIVLVVLLLICSVLLFVYFQKRRLDTAYKVLFEKNIENIDLQSHSTEKLQKKYQKSALTDDKQQELLNRIFAVMEDTSIICNTEFSVDKLAELVQSNNVYVSQTINTVLNKKFRSLLYGYRIREAQRILSEPDASKYTIESVGLKVGFKSRNGFNDAFKEITGVSPKFYLQSLQKER
jgi:tetratricopeptide (TPR) repeat protein